MPSSPSSQSSLHAENVWIRRATPILDNFEMTEHRYSCNQINTALSLDHAIVFSDDVNEFHLEEHEILDTFIDMTTKTSLQHEKPKEGATHPYKKQSTL
eukprot:CAMPEP_0195535274 /NCGR_PEP_ID=MMETSP0794_2-20130614/43954_1 /TAXON_ID=515487 /ORGANISM="Stephanopyxis turris, Strain CCMP 815" /LENGTH=98 /DNA_ID=CAMNT_0040668367 /DNA_START=204 /DNA_END=500 /DNA_ORIENTATION=-